MTSPRASLVVLVAVSLVWGSSWIANSVLSGLAGPLHLAVLRYGVAFLLLAIASALAALARSRQTRSAAARNGQSSHLADSAAPVPRFAILHALESPSTKRHRWYGGSLLLGCTMFALPELLILAAAEHGAAPFIPFIYAALPLGLSIAAGALRISAILAVGAMLVLLNGSLSFTGLKLGWALLIALAVALQGWSVVYAQAHLAEVATSRSCMVQVMAAFWVLEAALQLRHEPAMTFALRAWPGSALASLGALAGLSIALAYPLYYRLLAQLQPSQLTVSTWLQTLVAVGESVTLVRQRPGWPMLCAAAVLLACSAALLHPQPQEASAQRLMLGEAP